MSTAGFCQAFLFHIWLPPGQPACGANRSPSPAVFRGTTGCAPCKRKPRAHTSASPQAEFHTISCLIERAGPRAGNNEFGHAAGQTGGSWRHIASKERIYFAAPVLDALCAAGCSLL